MSKVEKAPGATTNTFSMTVKGMSVHNQTLNSQQVNVNVMFTSDTCGETLSLFDPSTKKQIAVPFEAVQALIHYTRKQRNKKE